MSAAGIAGLAAAVAVAALWELLAAAEGGLHGDVLARRLRPLARVGRDGRAPSAPERRRLALVGAATLFAGGWLLGGPLAALLAGAGGPAAAALLLRRRRARFRAELERAAPAVARALADALGAGHAVGGALVESVRGLEGAARIEAGRAAAALGVGEPVEAVLERLRATAGGRAWDTLVGAILLQREAGGGLATLLRQLAAAQEESLRLLDDARAATAQARFTGLVVTVLPAAAAALAELAKPGTVGAIAAQPLAAWLACFAIVLQLVALVAIRHLARVGA